MTHLIQQRSSSVGGREKNKQAAKKIERSEKRKKRPIVNGDDIILSFLEVAYETKKLARVLKKKTREIKHFVVGAKD